jgi:tetratricopeptide (TPR) repeat protein
MKKIRLLRLLLLFALIIAGGCTGWAVDSTGQGWDAFEDGDIGEARENFEDAISWAPSYADAYNGLGWCDLLEDELPDALDNFDKALENDRDLIDASAGASLAATEENKHEDAVDYADDVIDEDEDYSFPHNGSVIEVTIEDIRLAKAKSAAALGEFDTALAEIQAIDTEFSADPATAQGQAAILAKIEALISTYGGPHP